MINIYIFMLFVICSSLKAESLFTGTHENDSIGVFWDRYYSSGVNLEYQSKELISPMEYFTKMIVKLALRKDCFKHTKKCEQEMNGYSMSHLIYTPELFKGLDASRNDRPYAGIAYLGNSYSVHFGKWIYHNEFLIGNVGPSSGGRFVQEQIHSIMYFNTPRGWSNELKDKSVYNWNSSISFPFNKNIILPMGWGVGNLDLNGNLGLQLRWGQLSSNRTFMGHSMHFSRASSFYDVAEEDEYYVFIQPSLKLQYVNASVSGDNPYWTDSSWKGILDDRSYKEWERVLIYRSFISSGDNARARTEDLLVFNTVFNDLRYFSRFEARAVIDFLLRGNLEYTDPFYVLGLFNLIRPENPSLYAYAKYVSYQRIFQNLKLTKEQEMGSLLYLYRSGEFDLKRPHTSAPNNFQGQIQSGFVFRTSQSFFSVSWTLSSLEFSNDPALPNFHAWGRVQGGIFF
jgi:lipid A 3-O-deacylase